jgi:hypothetical protein
VRRAGVAQGVADDTGFDAGRAGVRVDRQDPVHLPEVEHDGGVDGLTRDRRPRADGQHRDVVRAADRHGGLDVRDIARRDDADRDPAVVRGVGGPHGPRRGVEPHRAVDGAQEIGPQSVRGGTIDGLQAHPLSLPPARSGGVPKCVAVTVSVIALRPERRVAEA